MKATRAKREYDSYIKVLEKIVAARGGDAARAVAEYPWRGRADEATSQPAGAVAMSSLLTGCLPVDDATF